MLPLSGRSDAIDLGPIRACRTEPSIGRSPLLFWVLAGSGRVRTGSTVYEVPAGELLWIPASVRYSMETDSDSVAFPILLPPSNGVSAGPATVTRLRVPPGWEDRLIHEFVHNLGYLRGDAAHPSSLFEMITRADDGATSLPQLPQSREAFEIAHACCEHLAPTTPRHNSRSVPGSAFERSSDTSWKKPASPSRAGGFELGSPRRWST